VRIIASSQRNERNTSGRENSSGALIRSDGQRIDPQRSGRFERALIIPNAQNSLVTGFSISLEEVGIYWTRRTRIEACNRRQVARLGSSLNSIS
jgi:hypothetical protein